MWCLGNTSVRSPLRLREGLIALKNSGLEGQIRGSKEADINFRNLLGKKNIVKLGNDPSFSVSRKWRLAMEELGFIYPNLEKDEMSLQHQIGVPDFITPNGKRLIEAESLIEQHDCFLRSFCAYYIDSNGLCSPFIFTLKILNSLLDAVGDSQINKNEMALIIQYSDPKTDIGNIVNSIIKFRKKRDEVDSEVELEKEFLQKADALGINKDTLKTYADLNFRYLKATGLVFSRGRGRGRGIAMVPEKINLVKKIIKTEDIPKNNLERYTRLCSGLSLPTDEINQNDNFENYTSFLEDELERTKAYFEDIKACEKIENITEKEAMTKARLGQGQFRRDLEKIEPVCRVTGLENKEFLIASHIKSWKESNNHERLDGSNGLLLSPHIDKLFDRNWISFTKDGNLIWKSEKAKIALEKWGIKECKILKPLSKKQEFYMNYHRNLLRD